MFVSFFFDRRHVTHEHEKGFLERWITRNKWFDYEIPGKVS